MRFIRYLFMTILCLGLVIGLVYGAMEITDLIKHIMAEGFTWEIVKDPFRGLALAAIDLAVLGQSYVVTREFIKEEDEKASQWRN